jgi:CBS domain-containing protein
LSFRENLWHDDLSHLELTDPLMVRPETSLRETIETMRKANKGCILICQGPSLRGIFTERDVIKRVMVADADLEAPVSDFMTPNPVTLRRSDPVGLAIRTMYEGGYRRLPVVDSDGVPIGIVSVKRLVRYLADHFSSAVYNLPPQPRQVQEAREGA